MGPIIVCIMTCCRRRLRLAAAVVLALTWGLVACGSDQSSQSRSTTSAGAAQRPVLVPHRPPCPAAPVGRGGQRRSVGRHRLQLGGACAKVKTVLVSSSVDPHDYEPSPRDAATFSGRETYRDQRRGLRPLGVKTGRNFRAGGTGRQRRRSDENTRWRQPAPVVLPVGGHRRRRRGHRRAEQDRPADAGLLQPTRRTAFTTALQPYTRLIDTIKAHARGQVLRRHGGNLQLHGRRAGAGQQDPAGLSTGRGQRIRSVSGGHSKRSLTRWPASGSMC